MKIQSHNNNSSSSRRRRKSKKKGKVNNKMQGILANNNCKERINRQTIVKMISLNKLSNSKKYCTRMKDKRRKRSK